MEKEFNIDSLTSEELDGYCSHIRRLFTSERDPNRFSKVPTKLFSVLNKKLVPIVGLYEASSGKADDKQTLTEMYDKLKDKFSALGRLKNPHLPKKIWIIGNKHRKKEELEARPLTYYRVRDAWLADLRFVNFR